MSPSLAHHSIRELQNLLARKEIQPKDIVASLADAIETRDPAISSYLSWDTGQALDACAQGNFPEPLSGIPIAIKDLISVKGHPCRCASKILEGYVPPYDAGAISRLKAAGGLPFGRTNMDEFAMGSSTENSAFKRTHNPWHADFIPGGSSGGSAAAVAAGLAIAALGTDTGGSIRQPAALCGCVGLKPTYGRVSRYGLVAYASSLDQIGPMTKTVEDAAILLQAISGADPKDSTCVDEPVPDYAALLGRGIQGMRLGIPKEYLVDGLDPQVRRTFDAAVELLGKEGAEIEEISLPHSEHAVSVYYIIATAEASANLARFDGVRYGHRCAAPGDLAELYTQTRAEGFGTEVKRRILLGTYVLSSGYYDAYYLRAQKLRTLIRNDFTQAFEKVDAILTPTTPGPAFRLGEKIENPLEMYLADIFTIAANLAGICGLSVPNGFYRTPDGIELPLGLQLLGAPFHESKILQLGHHYEQASGWYRRKPQH